MNDLTSQIALAIGLLVGNWFCWGVIGGDHLKGLAIGVLAAIITLFLCLVWGFF
jgi:hypothetical protein